jgi:hypothetical protein
VAGQLFISLEGLSALLMLHALRPQCQVIQSDNTSVTKMYNLCSNHQLYICIGDENKNKIGKVVPVLKYE